MKKEEVILKMKQDCLVAVVRAESKEQGEKIIDAIIAGGINFIEITYSSFYKVKHLKNDALLCTLFIFFILSSMQY